METKNSIKQRMISVAAKAWGVTNKEIEKTDPIVPLLIDACASEIAKVSSSINESRDKMGGKIMELLTPAELTSPYPARAILYAMPMDTMSTIDENNEFYFAKRSYVQVDNQEVEVFFTPTGNYKLLKAEIRYLGCFKNVYFKPNPFEKVSVCKSTSNSIEPDTLWIGLHIPKPINSLDGISFYFDLNNTSEIEEEIFYNALADSHWEIHGKSKRITKGFKKNTSKDTHVHFTNSTREFNKSQAVCNHINSFYKKKFTTIIEEDDLINYKEYTQKYPDNYSEVFKEDDLNELEGNLLWIKIRFKQHIPAEVLDNVNCTINCFPALNRRSEKVYINGKDKIAGLISEDNEIFFDLKSIEPEGNMRVLLSSNVAGGKQIENTGLLTLRQDNIGRFNSRNALELIEQMIDVYREEFMAFSKFKNINQDSVDDLHNAIRPFENLLDELYDISIDSQPYVMLKTSAENENLNVEVDYWLTNGALANDIQQEESLRYDSAELVRDKIFFMTPTFGGINRKKKEDLKNDFRYALLTRDRIVTKADIKSLCFKIFENLISEVEVKEGISNSTLPNSGLRRSIEIFISLRENHNSSKEVIEFLKEDFKTQLEDKSSGNLPFKIYIV